MNSTHRDDKRLLAGLLFLLMGVPAAWISSGYSLYGDEGLGAGAFPLMISIALSLVGAAEVVLSLRSQQRKGVQFREWRALFFLILGVVGFGVLAEPAGLLVAIGWTVACSCLSTPQFKIIEAIIILISLIAISSAIMIFGLGWSFTQLLP